MSGGHETCQIAFTGCRLPCLPLVEALALRPALRVMVKELKPSLEAGMVLCYWGRAGHP
jgi:hypothetical protein